MNSIDQIQIKQQIQLQLDQKKDVIELTFKEKAITEPEIIRKCHTLSRFAESLLLDSGFSYHSEMTISHDRQNFASLFGKNIYDGGCNLKFYLIKNKNET